MLDVIVCMQAFAQFDNDLAHSTKQPGAFEAEVFPVANTVPGMIQYMEKQFAFDSGESVDAVTCFR